MKPKVIIIGAGPAGLTAALELVRDGRLQPIVLEAAEAVGGLSRTVETRATAWTSAATASFPSRTG